MRILMMVVAVAIFTTAAFASPRVSPPNAATAIAEPTTQPTELATSLVLRDDAPSAVRELFDQLIGYREVEYLDLVRSRDNEQRKIEEFQKAIIAPTLKPSESPKFTNKGVWAFRSRDEKEQSIHACESQIAFFENSMSQIADPHYLPDINVLSLSEIKAKAKYSVDPDFVTDENLAARIDPSTIEHDLKSGWIGYVPSIRFYERTESGAVVDVIANVRAIWSPPKSAMPGGSRGTSNPNAIGSLNNGYSRTVPARIIAMPVEFDVIVDSGIVPSDAIEGHNINTAGMLFHATARDGKLYLNRLGEISEYLLDSK